MSGKLVLKNFQSFKDLTFPLSSGIRLIDGWNDDDQTQEGAGKSAVPNGICWVLYGRLPKDAKIDDVIKHGETSCSGELYFPNGDLIARSRKPNELYIRKSNGQIIKGKDAKETQEFIEEYIGCNFETYCQSTYFAQNYDKKFLTSNQEDKGKILSSIQNLQIFDKARKEVMELLKIENEKITSLTNQIQMEENNLKNFKSQAVLVESFIKDKISKHQQQVLMIDNQLATLNTNIDRILVEISQLEVASSDINLDQIQQNELDVLQAKDQSLKTLSEINFEKSQIETVRKSILAKEQEGNFLASKYSKLETKKKDLDSIETHSSYVRMVNLQKSLLDFGNSPSVVRLKSKISNLKAYLDNPTKICPSCGSELKNIDLTPTNKELSDVEIELITATDNNLKQLESVRKDMFDAVMDSKVESELVSEELKVIMTQLEQIASFLDQTKLPILEEITSRENETKLIVKQLDDLIKKFTQDKFLKSKLESDLSSFKRRLSDYELQYAQYSESKQRLGTPDVSQDYAQLGILNNQSQESEGKLGQISMLKFETQEYIKRLDQLKDGFKEIKSYVFTNALNELNFRTNQYLADLFNVEASIKFINEDQKIESRIVLDGRETGLGLLSGGQNRRFNLAVDLALADIVSYRKTSKLDFLILDEYFKDLSEISMEKCLDLLKARKSPVVLIEHNSMFKNIVDDVFFVRLENGTSYESKP